MDISESQDATFITSAILKFLEENRLADINIVGQTHDGASVMSEERGGVQATIREKYPVALYSLLYSQGEFSSC